LVLFRDGDIGGKGRPEGGREVTVYHKAISIFSSSYYHGSETESPVGFILTPQPDGYATLNEGGIAELEAILERYRPSEKIARRDAVYIRDPDEIDAAGGYIDFVYTVIPIGEVEASDTGWYSELDMYYMDDIEKDEVRKLAEGYWSGKPFTRDSGSLFEYRARSAEIVAIEVNE